MFHPDKPYEKVQLILRRHWLILFYTLLKFIFMFGLGFLIYFMASAYFGFESGTLEFAQFLLGLYLLMAWQALFIGLTDYFLDTWIITDHRIIDIHQMGFFKRDISELRYSKIQDVSVKVAGLIPTLFDYGDLVIQTAGAVQEFHFRQIPHPNQVKDKILHNHDQYMKDHVNDIEVHELNNTIV